MRIQIDLNCPRGLARELVSLLRLRKTEHPRCRSRRTSAHAEQPNGAGLPFALIRAARLVNESGKDSNGISLALDQLEKDLRHFAEEFNRGNSHAAEEFLKRCGFDVGPGTGFKRKGHQTQDKGRESSSWKGNESPGWRKGQ